MRHTNSKGIKSLPQKLIGMAVALAVLWMPTLDLLLLRSMASEQINPPLVRQLPTPTRPARQDLVDLGELVTVARRLGVENLFHSREAFIHSIKHNFLRVYNRQVNHTMFLAYPRADDVARRIVEVCRAYLELSQSVEFLSSSCSTTGGDGITPSAGVAEKSASDAIKRMHSSTRRLEKGFSGMFLEVPSSKEAMGSAAKPRLAKDRTGDYCARIYGLAETAEALKQRLVVYFFSPDSTTVSVQRLNLPSIRSLTGAIDAAAKQLKNK